MEKRGRLSGKTLGGKYLLGTLLGDGGFGTVYRGHHQLLNRPQAIKVLHEHYSRDAKFRDRFLREAKIVAALDHPHIVHIDDFGIDEQEGEVYLVMPFIDGGTFSEILNEQREPLPVEQVSLYLEQICSALDYAHQQEVVHLDLKPPNLLISKDRGLLLSDFGLAHSLNQEIVEGGTSLGHGTPQYMAPEHINGQPNKSSDVYALGVLLFQMLVSQLPFRGGTPEAIKIKHLTEPPPLLRSLRPKLPIELEEVLERALAKQAEQRFRSASALLNAFKGALARVQEQVLKAEEERLRIAEQERLRKVENERLQRAKQELALRAQIEQLQQAKEDHAREAEQERLRRVEEEQALRTQIERLQKAEEKRAHKAEEERLQRAKEERDLRTQIEQLQRAEEEQARKAEQEQIQRAKEELALRTQIEQLQRAEEERARKAAVEEVRALGAEIERLQKTQQERAKEERGSRYKQIHDFRPEAPPAIHTLSLNQIEKADLLIEDYNEAQGVRKATSGSIPVVQKPEDAGPAIIPSSNINTSIPDAPVNQSHQPAALSLTNTLFRPNEQPSHKAGRTTEVMTGAMKRPTGNLIKSPLPLPQAQSKPQAPTLKPPSSRTRQIAPKAPTQKPSTGQKTRSGRVPQSTGSQPASQTIHQRGGPVRPKSAIAAGMKRPRTMDHPQLHLILPIQIVGALVILFGVLYLNTTSTVTLTVTTQDYAHSLTLTLSSDKNQVGTVPAISRRQTFTKTGPEPATGSTMQATNYATGHVNFTNTGTADLQIPSQTVVATRNGVTFVTTPNVLIPRQSANPVPLPVPIQASNQGVSGNVLPGSITVIPPDSLTSIAQVQSQAVTADSLQATLTVSNPEATTGGEAHQVAAVTQQDLDNAKNDLQQQLQPDVDAWLQQLRKTGLVGQSVMNNDTLTNLLAVDTAEPNGTFSASINLTVTVLFAQLDAVQGVAVSQLNHLVQADKGANFVIIRDPQTITIDLAQQTLGQGNTVTVPATGQIGPNLDTTDVRNSIKGKSIDEGKTILFQRNQSIKTIDIQTQPSIFNSVSPWVDHIIVIMQPAPKK